MTQNKTEKNDGNNPTVDFSGLILGFSSAALHYFGHSTIQGKVSEERNLPLALQNIKIIELLRNKTLGNLTKEESTLVDRVIKDLNDKYSKEILAG